MSECISMQDETGQATNRSTLTLVASSLHKLPKISRRFHLTSDTDEQTFETYLLSEPTPSLIIKIIGTNDEQNIDQSRASIENTFKGVMQSLMEQSSIWIFNGSRTLTDLIQCDRSLIENDPNLIACEPCGNSQVFIYHSTVYPKIEKLLSQILQQQTSSLIPVISLLIQGDKSSVSNIMENISAQIPTIVLKGTGMIANQLATFYESSTNRSTNDHSRIPKEQRLSDLDFRRLTHTTNYKHSLIFVCQPGKDELDESILQAIGAAIRVIDQSRARITVLNFAMIWNKIEYTRISILNYNTIIDWKDSELDTCLEMAMLSNSISFVELLLDYGASLEHLALTSNSDRFAIKIDRTRSRLVELMIETIPVVTHLDSDKRIKAYLRLLFHWAVEKQYFELILSICTRLEDSVIAMLLVSQWCQYKQQTDYITSVTYKKHCRQFEQYAAEILDLYYVDNQENAIEFLNKKSLLYPEQQPTILIDDLCSKALVSTKCMQSYMNRIWYGGHFHEDKSFQWEVLICLVCLCPLLLFIPSIRNRVLQWNDLDKIVQRRDTFWSRLSNRLEPFRRFYRGNAVIRFHYNLASYMAFLILFSYTILFNYFPLNVYQEKRSNIDRLPIPITEIFVHIFLASIGVEEIRQVVLHVRSVFVKSPYWKKLADINRHRNTIWSFYRNDPWNVLDLVAFTLWIVGFSTRFIVRDHAFEVSKICMSLDLCLWYMRCLHVFLASDRLGPKLLMIFHTMKDLMLFLFFILIFLLAYSVTTYSLISTSSFVQWSNATHFTTTQTGANLTNVEILRNIIEWGTWKIFGSTSLSTSDSVEIKYSAKNDAYGFVTLLLTITFLVIAYVLLLNNLIALFNFTIQRVHGESHRAWCYHFYVVLKEYEEKDFFVPPFNLLLLPVSYYLRRKLNDTTRSSTFIASSNHGLQQIRRQQQRIAERYWKEKRKNGNGAVTQRSYVCRQCKLRTTEAEYIESTFL